MGQLFVVRHGQESLLRTNYDDLSEQGREQATALGECFAEHGWEFDLVYTGPAIRHRDTARRVGKAMEAAEASLLSQEEIERAAAKVSKEDVKTIRSNLDWVLKKMESTAAAN